jgi:redox-regulated HSP33 family molecular chaperone
MYSNGKKLSADRADIYVVDSTQLESQVNLNVNDHEQIIKLHSGDYAGSTVHFKIHK